MKLTIIDAHYFASEHRPSIRSTRPLTSVAKHATISIALPNNAEGRNGQFRNGGHHSASWLDTCKAQEAQSKCIPLHFQATRYNRKRALCGATQQSSGDVNRTVQNPINRSYFEVRILSVALRPNSLSAVNRNDYRRRSIESRHAHCTLRGKDYQEQGRVEGNMP